MAAASVAESKFEELKQKRLLEMPKEGAFITLCLARPDGKRVQYAGVLTRKSIVTGVPGKRDFSGFGESFYDPEVTGAFEAYGVHVAATQRVIPFMLNEKGEVLSIYSLKPYGPQEPYGFLLGEEHANALLASA